MRCLGGWEGVARAAPNGGAVASREEQKPGSRRDDEHGPPGSRAFRPRDLRPTRSSLFPGGRGPCTAAALAADLAPFIRRLLWVTALCRSVRQSRAPLPPPRAGRTALNPAMLVRSVEPLHPRADFATDPSLRTRPLAGHASFRCSRPHKSPPSGWMRANQRRPLPISSCPLERIVSPAALPRLATGHHPRGGDAQVTVMLKVPPVYRIGSTPDGLIVLS